MCGILVYECVCICETFLSYTFKNMHLQINLANHLTITYNFGKLTIWEMSFRKKNRLIKKIAQYLLPIYHSEFGFPQIPSIYNQLFQRHVIWCPSQSLIYPSLNNQPTNQKRRTSNTYSFAGYP